MKKLIDYDLNSPGRDYTRLYQGLHTLNAVKLMDSSYLTSVNKSVVEIRDYLMQFIDSNDALLVTEVGAWAAHNVRVDVLRAA